MDNFLTRADGRVVDTSFACYATDYLLAAVCGYLYFRGPAAINRASLGKKISLSDDQAAYATDILPKILLLQMVSTFLGGLFHHFLSDYQMVFDVLGVVDLLGTSFLFVLLISLTTNFPSQFRTISVIGLFSTELIFGPVGFKKLKVLVNVLGLFLSLYNNFKTTTKTTNQDVPGPHLDLARLATAFALVLAGAVNYLMVEKGCRIPRAYSQGSCPFPDWFNHNAVFHMVFSAAFYLMVEGIRLPPAATKAAAGKRP